MLKREAIRKDAVIAGIRASARCLLVLAVYTQPREMV